MGMRVELPQQRMNAGSKHLNTNTGTTKTTVYVRYTVKSYTDQQEPLLSVVKGLKLTWFGQVIRHGALFKVIIMEKFVVNREEEGGENPTLMTFKIDWSMFTRVRDAEDRKRCRCFHDDPLQPRDGTRGVLQDDGYSGCRSPACLCQAAGVHSF